MTRLRRFLLLLSPVLLLLVSGCEKTSDKPTPSTPAVTDQSVTLDRTTVTPGDVVVVTPAFDLDSTKSGWEIFVGGRKVQLARMETRRAAFVVPMVAAGTLTLDLSALGVQSPPVLTMSNYALIANPDQVIADFGTKLTAALTHLDQMAQDSLSPTPAQDVALVRTLQRELSTVQASLSPSQKMEAAFALQKMTFDRFDFAAIPPRRLTGDPADELINLGVQLTAKMVYVALATEVFMGAAAFPDPFSKFIAIAATATAVYQMVQAFKLIGRISDRFDMIHSIEDLLGTGPTSLATLTTSPSNFAVSAQARTIQIGDANASSALQAIFLAERTFSRLRRGFDFRYNQIRSLLGATNAALTPYVNPIRQAALRRKKVMAANLVRIRNVSNSAINVVATALNNTLTLRATSSITTTTPFTFDITYNNAALGLNASKTINAEFKPATDSTAFFQQAVVGNWVSTWYTTPSNPSQPGQIDRVMLQANGTGKRLSSVSANGTSTNYTSLWGTDPFYDITWTVSKNGNAYYLSFGDLRWTTVRLYGRITYPRLSYRGNVSTGYTINSKY